MVIAVVVSAAAVFVTVSFVTARPSQWTSSVGELSRLALPALVALFWVAGFTVLLHHFSQPPPKRRV